MAVSYSPGGDDACDRIVPDGVVVRDLALHADERGSLTEIFRQSWHEAFRPLQWNASRSEARVLRGVHVHRLHTDYLVVLAGAMLLALHDIRPSSPTRGRSVLLPLDGKAPKAVVIPPGVAHGFYFAEPSMYLCGVDEYWDGSDEIGCRFDSPELDLRWPNLAPTLSARDNLAGSYAEMVRQFFEPGEAPVKGRE
jgi:dTDP-4-dehydrorhamnose 3,5-epimerase